MRNLLKRMRLAKKNDALSVLFVTLLAYAAGMAYLFTLRAQNEISHPNFFWPILFFDIFSFLFLIVDVDTHFYRMKISRHEAIRAKSGGPIEIRRMEVVVIPFILYVLLLANFSAYGWGSPFGTFKLSPEDIEFVLVPLVLLLTSSWIWKIQRAAKKFKDLPDERFHAALHPYLRPSLRQNAVLRWLIYITTALFAPLWIKELLGGPQVGEGLLVVYGNVLACYAFHNSVVKATFKDRVIQRNRGHLVAGSVFLFFLGTVIAKSLGYIDNIPDFLPHFTVITALIFAVSANRLQLLTIPFVEKLLYRKKQQEDGPTNGT